MYERYGRNLENELQLTALTYRFLSVLLKDGGKSAVAYKKFIPPLAVETVKYIEAHYAKIDLLRKSPSI